MFFWLQILGVFVLFIALWYAISIVYRRFKTQMLQKLCAEQKAIVLTYDDGPSDTLTEQIAELLKARSRRAVFFMLGQAAQDGSQTAQMIKQQGHDIGSHTHFHSNAWRSTPWQHAADIKHGQASLAQIGIKTNLYRPPFGKSTLGSLIQAALSRSEMVFWTIDSQDSWDRRPIPDILDDIRRNNGGVVLMHDRERPLRGPTPEHHPDYLIALTTAILDLAQAEGYDILRYTDLVKQGNTAHA